MPPSRGLADDAMRHPHRRDCESSGEILLLLTNSAGLVRAATGTTSDRRPKRHARAPVRHGGPCRISTLESDRTDGEKLLGPNFLLTEFSKERKWEIVSFTVGDNRDEAMSSARLFGRPRHSSIGEVHVWKNLRRRTKTARRVEDGLIVGRADRSFFWLVPHGTIRFKGYQ